MSIRPSGNASAERTCAFCEFGTLIPNSADAICEKHGLVRANHTCRSFRYDLLKREPRKNQAHMRSESKNKELWKR
jgi:hypothetical protein